jgi:hypothetical protein
MNINRPMAAGISRTKMRLDNHSLQENDDGHEAYPPFNPNSASFQFACSTDGGAS